MRFILLITTIQSHVVYDWQTSIKSSEAAAFAVSCKKQLLYNNEIVQYCEKHQSLSSVNQSGQFTYSHDSPIFNSLYTEKAQDVTLNFTVHFRNLPQFALFGLVSQISIEDSNVSVNIPQQLEAGALVCFLCALNASSSSFSFSASGQNASGLVMAAQTYLKLDFVLVQARLRGNSSGLAFSGTQTAFSLSSCNVSCYLVQGSSSGAIIGSILDITFIADDVLVCVNDNIPNFGSGAVSIQGSIVNNCNLCRQSHFAYGLCLKYLDFGELRQNSLVCSESFAFDGQVCSCPPGFVLNVSKCINLLEVSSELQETSFTLYQELNQKVSYTYLQGQISDITVQLQSDKDELKTEVANIKKECEDAKKQLSQTITGLQQQVTELQQTVMQLKAEKENYFTKEEIQQMIKPLLCPVGAKIVDGSCTCPELAVVTNGICTCPPYSSVVDDKCQCGQYAAMTKYGCECRDDMAMQPNGVCVCPNPSQVVIDNICQCPIKGQILNGICQCQDGASIVNNECQCPVDSVTVNNGPMTYCKCPDSLPQNISGRCCPTFAEVSGSSCKCPENSVVAGNSCKCDSNSFTFSSSAVLVCQACPSGSSPDVGQTTCICSGNGVYTQDNNSCTVQECSGNSFYSLANKSCTACGANSTVSSNICVCDTNSYQTSNLSGSLTCFTCPVGSVSNNNTKTCDCIGNFFYSSSNNSCTACGPNQTVQNNICGCNENSYVSNNVGSLICFTCPQNSLSNNNSKTCECTGVNFYYNQAANSCTACPENSVSNGNRCSCDVNSFQATNGVCVLCPVGSAPDAGKTTCVCENGLYFEKGANKCVQCPPNSYYAGACYACPSGATINTGKTSCDCTGLFFYTFSNNSCTACPTYTKEVTNNVCICHDAANTQVVDNVCTCKVKYQYIELVQSTPPSCWCPYGCGAVSNNACVLSGKVIDPTGSPQSSQICVDYCSYPKVNLVNGYCNCPVGATWDTASKSCKCTAQYKYGSNVLQYPFWGIGVNMGWVNDAQGGMRCCSSNDLNRGDNYIYYLCNDIASSDYASVGSNNNKGWVCYGACSPNIGNKRTGN
ncbi:Conserved_hypothetical protein [Hexamita inflata]|uniref:Uncharacterized protein n=1 Tax=Hexamita inflata TaxID=28002 RepID=A0AA86P7S0_9EUKA|nr:Conserved hypothetical protein [Hexamita inflata]CAI9933637.1 Conserved hypothetical protein [Hexamita inflata]